jgi:hypothetical protein
MFCGSEGTHASRARLRCVVGGNGAVIDASKKKHFRCDAPDRGDETRVAHASTFLTNLGRPDGAWSCLELSAGRRRGC